MRQEAEEHAADDEKRREVVDARNRAEAQVYEIEKALREHGEKISADERAKIEQAVNQVQEACKGDDGDAITKSAENLTVAAQEIGKIMYEEAAKQAATPAEDAAGPTPETAGATAGAAKKDDDVIDADYEVKE